MLPHILSEYTLCNFSRNDSVVNTLSPVCTLYRFCMNALTSFFSLDSTLEIKKWSVGGVKNSNNSCFISVVLQEFAEFFEYYEPMLVKAETDEDKKELQTSLKECIRSIRQGELVSKQKIEQLRSSLRVHGWQEPCCYRLRNILHKIFPCLFPPIVASPYRLYDTIRTLLDCQDYIVGNSDFYKPWQESHVFPDERPVVFVDDTVFTKTYSVDERIQEIVHPSNFAGKALFKIRLPIGCRCHFSETIETPTFRFVLRQIHFSPKDLHIATMRKVANQWVTIDDDTIYAPDHVPQHGVFQLMYERLQVA